MYGDLKITKREVLVSFAIIAVMLLFGFVIHGNISDNLMLKYQEYNTAIQINEDADMFAYGMRTDIGNAFAYGELKAVDTVTYDEIGGKYSFVKKVKEKYTSHTRTVTKTRIVNGKTQTYTTTETYWTWDEVDSWSKHCKKIKFLDVEFDYGTINFQSKSYIKTIRESSNIRYQYYGSPTECKGTLYTNLKDNTINDSSFYINKSIDETISSLESKWQIGLFWTGWIVLVLVIVIGFCYFDNRWLEDKTKNLY